MCSGASACRARASSWSIRSATIPASPRMQVAGIELEPAEFHLMVAHDDRRRAGGERIGEVPGSDPRGVGIDKHLQPVEWVAGRIGPPAREDAAPRRKPFLPQIERRRLAGPRRCVVALCPGVEAAIAPAMPSLPTFMPRPMP